MSENLVQRWFDSAKPFSIGEIKKKYAASYASAIGLDEDFKNRLQAVFESIDEVEVREMLRAFAEENFSEDALRAAVEFFESDLGKKFMEERRKVHEAGQTLIGKYIGEIVKKAGLA